MASPEEPRSRPGSTGWKNEEQEKNFPFLVVTSFGLVYILLITLTIAYISSLLLSPCSTFGPERANTSHRFLCSSNQRASEQAIIGVLIFASFSGAGAL
jgi:hypothetical protein